MKLGKTNIISYSSSGSSSSNGDVILPAPPASISAISGDKNATLNLSYTSTSYITGVEVRYKTGGYPANTMDGTGKTVTGTPTSINITGLTNGNTYYFRVFLYNEVNDERYYQTSIINARITGKPAGFSVSIIPAAQTASYILVDKSTSFDLTIPQGHGVRLYLIGGGYNGENGQTVNSAKDGYGGAGGNGGTTKIIVSSLSGALRCIASIGGIGANTSLNIGGITYNSNDSGYSQVKGAARNTYDEGINGSNGITTPYGIVGSSGGSGGEGGGTEVCWDGGQGGTGAGSGGGGAYTIYDSDAEEDVMQSADSGWSATKYGCGGGGGGGGFYEYGSHRGDAKTGGGGGYGMQGCVIFELI